MSELKIIITGDEKQAAAALDRVKGKVAETGQTAEKSSQGVGQLTKQMGTAVLAMGGLTLGTGALATALRRIQQEMEETLKIYDRAIKNYEDTKILIYKGRLEDLSDQYHANKISAKEYTDQALALNAAIASTSINAEIAKTREELKKTEAQMSSWLTKGFSLYGPIIQAIKGPQAQALREELASLEREREEVVKQANAGILRDTKRTEAARVKLAKDAAKAVTDTKKNEADARIKAEREAAKAAVAARELEMRAAEAAAQYQLELTQAKMQMALTYGQVIGDYAAQAANGQMSMEQAAANAAIDIFADMLTKKLAAWAAMNAGMGNFLKAGAAMAAIAAVKGILKHSVGGGAAITPVSIVPSGAALPAIPSAGGGSGGGGAGAGAGERGAPVASQIGEIIIYQSIYINGNVMASNFYRTVLEASAAGARAGGR